MNVIIFVHKGFNKKNPIHLGSATKVTSGRPGLVLQDYKI